VAACCAIRETVLLLVSRGKKSRKYGNHFIRDVGGRCEVTEALGKLSLNQEQGLPRSNQVSLSHKMRSAWTTTTRFTKSVCEIAHGGNALFFKE
jgi:hypothetical protein